MKVRFVVALLLAGALLLPTTSSTRAIGNPDIRVRLPFSETQCRTLIERGAPFQLGGPDTGPGDCFIIIIGGAPGR
ncbi:MAG: hypothetical protein ACRD2Z_07640 [Thermoanaerobaculia bacterium]